MFHGQRVRAKTVTQSVHFLLSLMIQNMQNKLTTSSFFQCFCKIKHKVKSFGTKLLYSASRTVPLLLLFSKFRLQKYFWVQSSSL